MTTQPSLVAAQNICDRDIIAERWRQMKKWGPQSHPDGTGNPRWASQAYLAQLRNDSIDRPTWLLILEEEVYEAFAETEPEALRTELIQVAAVCVAWVEDIDRRQFARVVEPLPIFTDQMEAQPA